MNRLIHDLEGQNEATTGFKMPIVVGIVVGTLLLGTLTGFGISKFQTSSASGTTADADSGSGDKKQSGIADKKTFKDQAEGVLREGGIEGEGSFHLQRPGGESQNVYLTSTTVDLSEFIGKKVRVWGQTFTGEKAGWLMDVGLVETL